MIVIVRRGGAAPHVHRLTHADLCAYATRRAARWVTPDC
jgi:hypothetical protein